MKKLILVVLLCFVGSAIVFNMDVKSEREITGFLKKSNFVSTQIESLNLHRSLVRHLEADSSIEKLNQKVKNGKELRKYRHKLLSKYAHKLVGKEAVFKLSEAKGIAYTYSQEDPSYLIEVTAIDYFPDEQLIDAVVSEIIESGVANKEYEKYVVAGGTNFVGDWGLINYFLESSQRDKELLPATKLIIAHKSGKSWAVGLEGTSIFNTLVDQAPELLVSKHTKNILKGIYLP
jgi:hypothetical protein